MKFKENDIVVFYESIHPWIVRGYVRLIVDGEWANMVSIDRIELPSVSLKSVPGLAKEEDLLLA